MGLHYVLADDGVVFVFDGSLLADHLYAASACLVGGFDDLELLAVLVLGLLEFESVLVARQDLGLGAEIEFFGVFASEDSVVALHLVLAAQLPTVREVVHPLELGQLPDEVGFARREPKQVPLLAF